MKLVEVLTLADGTRPNMYSQDLKTGWINEVEHKAVDQVLNQAKGNDIEFRRYRYEEDAQRELLIPDEFGDVYTSYLHSKIDLYNGDIARYNNDCALFDAAWREYASWYRRHHRTKDVILPGPEPHGEDPLDLREG